MQISEANFRRTVASVYSGGQIMSRSKFRSLQKLTADLGKDENLEIPFIGFFPYERMKQRIKRESDVDNRLKDVTSIFL